MWSSMQAAAVPSSQLRAFVCAETLCIQQFPGKSHLLAGIPQIHGEHSWGVSIPHPREGPGGWCPPGGEGVLHSPLLDGELAGTIHCAPSARPLLIISSDRVSDLPVLLHRLIDHLNGDVSLLPSSQRTSWQFPGKLCPVLVALSRPPPRPSGFIPLPCGTGHGSLWRL